MTKSKDWATRGEGSFGSDEPPAATPGAPLPGSRARHGTEGGFSMHQNRGEEPCEACRTAKAHADWRRRQAPEATQRNRLRAKAQSRALMELTRRHLEEYHELYDANVLALFKDAGLAPPQLQRKKILRKRGLERGVL